MTCNSEKLALQRSLLVCLGSAHKTNSPLKVPMSLIILCVGPAPRADRHVAPVVTQQWEAAQLWTGSGDGGGVGEAAPPGPSEQGEISQHPGVRRGSEMAQCPHVSLWRQEV